MKAILTNVAGKERVTTGSRYCPSCSEGPRGGISITGSPRPQELGKLGVLAGARVTEGHSHCQKTELGERRVEIHTPPSLLCPLALCTWLFLVLLASSVAVRVLWEGVFRRKSRVLEQSREGRRLVQSAGPATGSVRAYRHGNSCHLGDSCCRPAPKCAVDIILMTRQTLLDSV